MEWLSVGFECPPVDRGSSNNAGENVVMEVGGESVTHSSANTLPFEEAVSHLRGAVMAWLSAERDRLRRSLEREK